MASKDRRFFVGALASAATANVPAFLNAANNRRTERFDMVFTGNANITVAGTGVRNRGSILGAVTSINVRADGRDIVNIDGRLMRFMADQMAPSALPATRLTGAGVANTPLREIVPVWLSAPRTANPNETKFVETNKQLAVQVGYQPNLAITGVAEGPALAGSILNLNANIVQVCDDQIGEPPWFVAGYRQIQQDVSASNTQFKIDLRGSRLIRGIAIQQDTNQGEVSDIIVNLVLRTDQGTIIGDTGIPFADLVDAMAAEYGGSLPAGYLFIDFCRYGRLTSMFNAFEGTNPRLELSVAPSAVAGATGSKVRVAFWEYERTPATAAQLQRNF